ncbi:hypothetical protein D9758_007237 [Tetrapyrgos nigripes]|uniref:Protein Zds1 C-terminal domain-containing protein n=1 Tax=Tetrapyrgos nigripes TaxID=182062 RepID=A0A8H5D0S0_9AGAR|nr:hypothetical protein D9758_007237 [Tetrapyrgos nigripes]
MQPSHYDIQREVEALRDIRRRSTAPGALAIDPDLPAQSSSSSNPYWSGDDSSSNEEGSSTTSHASDSTADTDDPFHLFWVPASVHPEIAPAEFRAFLKEHSRSPPPGDGPAPTRSSSLSVSSGLGRKRSMLSRQYSPSENDGVGETEEKIVPLRRNRTGRFANQGPQLTINDLQKLEELAEEASETNDPTKFRNILRRSLSLNMSPTAMDQLDAMPEMEDEADVPIIARPPGQILRRAARTRIRKPGLPGDGGGHRFSSTRRGSTARAGTLPSRTSSDRSSSDHGHTESTEYVPQRQRTLSDDFHSTRPDSFSMEASIFDAYAHDEEEHQPPTVITSAPSEAKLVDEPSSILQLPTHEHQPSLFDALSPVLELPSQEPEPEPPLPQQHVPPQQPPLEPEPQLHQPQPQRLLTPQDAAPELPSPSRTPSPSSAEGAQGTSPTPSFLSSPPSPQLPVSQPTRKEKDKKGLFKWGSSDKSSKKHKDKDHTRADSGDKEKEKEKESGFFGSLFGGNRKNKDSDNAPPVAVSSGNAGREAAQALLGASKSSKNYQPPPSPGAAAINNYSRYPIHVERAIYRLSHIKLANPRRPLYEQVLISNLMFWYLGVINKAQNPSPTPNGQAGVGAGGGQGQGQAQGQAQGPGQVPGEGQANGAQEKEQKEKEQREAELREKERLEKEVREKEQREREQEMKKREVSPKRGSLTKAGPGGARRAEIAVKGPQYEMQHREMQQEYGYGGGYNAQPPQGMPKGRGPTSPPPGSGQRTGYQSQSSAPVNSIPPRLVQPPDSQTPDHLYYSTDMAHQQSQPQAQRLPPGAMPPADHSNWGSQRQSPPLALIVVQSHRLSKSMEEGGHQGGHYRLRRHLHPRWLMGCLGKGQVHMQSQQKVDHNRLKMTRMCLWLSGSKGGDENE